MTGTRAVITLWLGAAVMLDQMRDQMLVVALLLIAGLALTRYQAGEVNMRRLRDQCTFDLVVLLAVLPAAVITGFVAAGSGEFLPAEQTAFLQLTLALLLAMSITALLSVRLFAGERSDIANMYLPVVLIIISLPFVLHDYRNQTVVAMITVSYFLATVAIPFGVIVDQALRRYVGVLFAVLTVFVGLVIFDPGLGNLGERSGVVQMVTWGSILLGLTLLAVLPHVPERVPGLATARETKPTIVETVLDRRRDDSG